MTLATSKAKNFRIAYATQLSFSTELSEHVPIRWSDNKSYKQYLNNINKHKVVNNAAERAIKL